MLTNLLGNVVTHVEKFEASAHDVLSHHEAATRSRVVTLDATRRKLHGISVQQQELLMESLECVEGGLYRAAHVSAWQAFVDFFGDKLSSDGLASVKVVRPKWRPLSSVEDLLEFANDYELMAVGRSTKLLTKAEAKVLQGMLSKRNECAHPSSYRPDLNETLGYVSELINRISTIQRRVPQHELG